jgi:gamma-glutamylcyclotransferase (GGCT)/AIG2-like uncharacterized protein YtfP
MPLLFTYGTLQIGDIQLATFGRLVRGERDEVVGCERQVITVDDPEVMAATGRSEHMNLHFNGNPNARFAGTVLELTDAELAEADRYEKLAAYARREVKLASGRTAWAYVYTPE